MASKNKTPWLRFSLRAALGALSLLAVLLALVGNELRRRQREVQAERRIIAKIEQAGGTVELLPYRESRWTRWLPAESGFRHWAELRVGFIHMQPASRAVPGVVPQGHTDDRLACNDEVFEQLRGLQYVHSVNLTEAWIPCDAMGKITGASRLGVLWLGNVRVGQTARPLQDADLAQICQAGRLTTLNLDGSAITVETIRRLRELPYLRSLYLSWCPVTDESCVALRELKSLTQLRLVKTDMTDEGVRELARLPRIEQLNLSLTKISDAAVPSLAQMQTLRIVELEGTKVTDGGIRRLKEALPKAKVNPIFGQ